MERKYRCTVCELPSGGEAFEPAWQNLIRHVKRESSQVVLLPELPFCEWLPRLPEFQNDRWQTAVLEDSKFRSRLADISPAQVIASRPIEIGGRRINQAYLADSAYGARPLHEKHHLPLQENFWEATWFHRGSDDFSVFAAENLVAGILICTELWFPERARAYGKAGAHAIFHPRATVSANSEKWLIGGRAAAILAGAYVLSSNRAPGSPEDPLFGGQGWAIDPDGNVLGVTSAAEPFLTIELDADRAERCKQTYPRYIE